MEIRNESEGMRKEDNILRRIRQKESEEVR
jgi:hypothetical protein